MEFGRVGELQVFLCVCDRGAELNGTCSLPKAQTVESICYFVDA